MSREQGKPLELGADHVTFRVAERPVPKEPSMSDYASEAPRAHVRIVYTGPVAPHWEVLGDYGDRNVIDEFRARVFARLVLLTRDDPQFRRNRERIVRDAERENVSIEWDLGLVEADG